MNSSEVQVRCATRDDADKAWQTFQIHLNWINVWHESEKVVQRRLNRDSIENLFRIYPGAVAETDGLVIGWAASEVRDIGVLEIMNIYVDDSYRNQGIGQTMLRLIEDQCVSGGIHTIIAFGSDVYYPGKRLPTGLFAGADYEVTKLGPRTEMYLRHVEIPEEESMFVHPVRRTQGFTVDDLEIERIRENTDSRVIYLDLDSEETSSSTL